MAGTPKRSAQTQAATGLPGRPTTGVPLNMASARGRPGLMAMRQLLISPCAFRVFDTWSSSPAETPPLVRIRSQCSAPRSSAALTSSDRKSTRLNSSHVRTSYAVFCLKKKNTTHGHSQTQIQHHPLGVIVHAQGSTQRSYILVSPYGHVIHHGINSLIRFGHTIDEGHS